MGMIRIEVVGSFSPNRHAEFTALQTGHADAVAPAIEWLAGEVLPEAIRQDHRLQNDGDYPENGFGAR